MGDHAGSDPYQVGRPELELLLTCAGAEFIYVGSCGAHHKFDVGGSDVSRSLSRRLPLSLLLLPSSSFFSPFELNVLTAFGVSSFNV